MASFQRFSIYRATVRDPSGPVELILFLPPEDLERIGGIPPEIVVGKLLDPNTDDLVPTNFARNQAFVAFMHRVIRNAVPQIGEFVAAAERQQVGWLHIHDARAFDVDRELAATDVIGSFRIDDGVISADSYEPNPDHQILSEHGLLTPHPAIQEAILSAMRELRYEPKTPQ